MKANPGDRVSPSSTYPGGAQEPGSEGGTALLERPAPEDALAPMWNVVVWNDPVNLMDYVAYVFRSYFGYSQAKADQLMLQVHDLGRAIVATGSREESEKHTQAMHQYGLQATVERAE